MLAHPITPPARRRPRRRLSRVPRPPQLAGFVVVLALTAAGCSGACRKATPYVPFLEDGGAPAPKGSEPVTGLDAGAPVKPGVFKTTPATLATTPTTKLQVDGLEIPAPQGQVVLAGIVRDLDGDGQRDAVAFVQPAGGGGGELRHYRGEGGGLLPSKVVTAATGGADALTLPAPCMAKLQPGLLTLVGPHTVAVDVRPTCGEGAAAARRVVVAAFAPVASIRWSARVLEPPTGFTLGIEIEAPDKDGDGVDDPTLVFSLEGGGPPFDMGDKLVARIGYWDRPSGLSLRDRFEPEKSFQTIAQNAAARATRKATAGPVAGLVRRLRLLHGALCSEGGSPLVDPGGEHGIACGTSRALEDGAAAEVRAALSLGDAITALAARERLAVRAKSSKLRAEIDKAILAVVPAVFGTARELKVAPHASSKGTLPAWGTLAFEKSGALLVRTQTSVVRVDAAFEETEASDVSGWPLEVLVPGKDTKLAQVVDACDAPWLSARMTGHDVPTGSRLVPLPLMGVTRCSGSPIPVASTPVAFGPQGLLALVQHELVLIPTVFGPQRTTGTLPPPAAAVVGPFVMGAPRSPGGGYLVVPTRFGVARREEASGAVTLVRAKDLEGLYLGLRDCAINDAGTRIACVRENHRVVVVDVGSGTPAPAPSTSAPAPSTSDEASF